jgi:hypothetical protein
MSILGQPGNIRVRPYPKTKLKRGKTGGVAQVEDHLPGKAEALSSNTRTTKRPQKTKSQYQVLAEGKDQPLGNSRTVSQAAPTCSPPCGHSAGNSPSRGSGSRQSGRGHHTPGSSRGTCVREFAGVHRNCTGWAVASGTPDRPRRE